MAQSKTLFVSYQERNTTSNRINKFKYKFCNKPLYWFNNKVVILLSRINYDGWKKSFFLQVIDILWNSSLIALTWFLWLQSWLFLKGVAVTLFFIILFSYVKDFKALFNDKRRK